MGHPLIGRCFRVIRGETGWCVAPTGDYEVATIVDVCEIGGHEYAMCTVYTTSGGCVGRPLFAVAVIGDALIERDED